MDQMFFKRYLKIALLQFVFGVLIVLSVTVIRLSDIRLFDDLKEVYVRYACSETDLSLVTKGEAS